MFFTISDVETFIRAMVVPKSQVSGWLRQLKNQIQGLDLSKVLPVEVKITRTARETQLREKMFLLGANAGADAAMDMYWEMMNLGCKKMLNWIPTSVGQPCQTELFPGK